jgi:hypothetical protein
LPPDFGDSGERAFLLSLLTPSLFSGAPPDLLFLLKPAPDQASNASTEEELRPRPPVATLLRLRKQSTKPSTSSTSPCRAKLCLRLHQHQGPSEHRRLRFRAALAGEVTRTQDRRWVSSLLLSLPSDWDLTVQTDPLNEEVSIDLIRPLSFRSNGPELDPVEPVPSNRDVPSVSFCYNPFLFHFNSQIWFKTCLIHISRSTRPNLATLRLWFHKNV